MSNQAENTQKRVINLYLEANPNPNSLKFVANYMLVPEGENYDFPDLASAQDAPLAQQLFALPYVKRVFFMSNFVTVTKNEDVEWVEIQDEIKGIIKAYLETNKPLMTRIAPVAPVTESEAEVDMKIREILEEYIRPAVEQDGGAIHFHSFEDGVVKVILQGSCSGCPSSTVTLKAGIENLLKKLIPEVQTVEAING
jgi:NFU1 iron-sulfur cluster scaffold homolog, mitochondrial